MKHLRVYERDNDGKPIFTEVGLDVVLGEAIVELIEWGVDEDCHFMGSCWRDITDDELETSLNDTETLRKAMQHIEPFLVMNLKDILRRRREEATKHG